MHTQHTHTHTAPACWCACRCCDRKPDVTTAIHPLSTHPPAHPTHPPTRKVLCDGRPVALPPGMEGLLVLNISSFMGGVDLW